MTEWAGLRDAYGSAEQVPAILEAAELSGTEFGPAWDAAWSHLCHQGTVYSASYAAIPLLADMCSRQPVRGFIPGLQLAGSILASVDGPTNPVAVRDAYAPEISVLHAVAEASLGMSEDDTEFIYGLETLAALEDLGVWQRTLSYCAAGEAPLECRACGTELLLRFDDGSPRITSWNTEDGERDVKGAEPAAGSPEARLLDLAQVHGREAVARDLRLFFGTSTCPACAAGLKIADSLG
ncbi:hypothetical protein WBG06_11210 [Nocardioides sp. CCNWLW239]|uniref:hypothetical protein n=1 Tax=Nocardioides sp. CCNWLW239 TaxID=3128902 RepID=UPI00301A4A75